MLEFPELDSWQTPGRPLNAFLDGTCVSRRLVWDAGGRRVMYWPAFVPIRDLQDGALTVIEFRRFGRFTAAGAFLSLDSVAADMPISIALDLC